MLLPPSPDTHLVVEEWSLRDAVHHARLKAMGHTKEEDITVDVYAASFDASPGGYTLTKLKLSATTAPPPG